MLVLWYGVEVRAMAKKAASKPTATRALTFERPILTPRSSEPGHLFRDRVPLREVVVEQPSLGRRHEKRSW